jgi:hypothetical protein
MTDDDLRQLYQEGRTIWRRFPRLRGDLPHVLADLAARYHTDHNPCHVWQAYGYARAAGVPIPDWVLGYLDRVAETMHVRSINPPTERQIARAAADALELPRGGRKNVFLEWPKQNHESWIAREVKERLDDGSKLYVAAADIGREHPTVICRLMFPQCRKPLSRATVERYYHAWIAQQV